MSNTKTIKLKEFIKIREVLTRISNNKFPIKISYEIAKFLRNTDGDMVFYTENLNRILNEYKDNSSEETIKIIPEKVNDCNVALQELEEQEIEVPYINLEIGSFSEIELTPEEVYWFILILK